MSETVLSSANFDKLCRLCLTEKRPLNSIFKTEMSDSAVPLLQRIMTCASIVMYEGDGLPEQICSKCLQAVNQSYALREQAERADAQLREILLQSEQKAEDTTASVTLRLNRRANNAEHGGAESQFEAVNGPIHADDDDYDDDVIVIEGDNNLDSGKKVEEVNLVEDVEIQCIPDVVCSKSTLHASKSPEDTARLLARLSTNITVAKKGPNSSSLNDRARSSLRTRNVQAKGPVKTAPNKIQSNKRSEKKIDPSLLDARRALITEKVNELGTKTEGGKIYCKECHIFIGFPYFYNHVKYVHVKVRDHLCEDCGYRAQTGHILRQHINAVHSDRKFKCELCSHRFGSVKALRHHVTNCHGSKERTAICQFCGKGFYTSHYLRNHIRTHTQETPYKCRFCDRRFSFKWPCTTHERLHTGVKPYKCSFCPEAFTQNCVRKNHEYKAHGNEEFNPKNRKPRKGLLREKKKGKGKVEPDVALVALSQTQSAPFHS